MLTDLNRYLNTQKKEIINEWVNLILDNYYKKEVKRVHYIKNSFQNPVGYIIFKEIKNIYSYLLSENKQKNMILVSIDNIMRIMAIQNYLPSQSISFFIKLKLIIRKKLNQELLYNGHLVNQVILFEDQIDEILLLAFDSYILCREKIYNLKNNDVKKMYYNFLKHLIV